jgi:hypothetical protein
MKVKAIIWREDHTNDVIVLKKKQIEGKVFRHDNTTYFLNPNAPQITWTRPNKYLGLSREYFATFYYMRGISSPFPVSDLMQFVVRPGKGDKSTVEAVIDPEETKALQKKTGTKSVVYKNIVDMGVPAEELAAIFNPWFYRQLAAKAKDTWEMIQFYASLGALAGVVYIIYMLSTGHFMLPTIDEIVTGAVPVAPAASG